ncbi:hypothetical protein NE237_024808 [Protea cynaroides]|uniref:Uncharacterized protein n=1 Tax=Protea cynaroides TaxID=273540 RepID=A0A9Q0H0Q7_9MAGN|nr:hypothetical protein NE237_024808 [Protea cynaroides]
MDVYKAKTCFCFFIPFMFIDVLRMKYGNKRHLMRFGESSDGGMLMYQDWTVIRVAREIFFNKRQGGDDDAFERCRSKNLEICKYLSQFEKIPTLDDKRMVPTGPNPLHNR